MILFNTKNTDVGIKGLKLEDIALVLGFLILSLLPLAFQNNDYVLQVFTHALLLAAIATAWNILGISGSISLGHAAFFGAGAYASALLSMGAGLSCWVSIPLGGLLASGLSLIMGLICLRLRGAYFALATLAFVEIPRVITDNWDGLTRGSLGLAGLPGLPSLKFGFLNIDIGASVAASYYFILVYGVLLLCLAGFVFRSNLGLALHAVREEEIAAESIGIQTDRYRLLSLLLSAFLTGITGACYAHLIRNIGPGLVYGLHFSAIPMVLAICGGRFTILGPALAALILYPADQFIFHPLLPAGHEFLYGAVLIIAVIYMPNGFWGSLRRSSSRQN